MKIINFGCGCHVTDAAEQLVIAARLEDDHSAQGNFNGITLTADDDCTVEGIVAFYHEENNRLAEEYRNSPEGKQRAREAEERKQKLQQQHNALMQKLPSLDFTNEAAVLEWLCEFQPATDHLGVGVNVDSVLSTFAAHGYEPGVNCGEAFNGEDRDNHLHWLVGQALDCLMRVGAIHQMFPKFAQDWKKKFLTETA